MYQEKNFDLQTEQPAGDMAQPTAQPMQQGGTTVTDDATVNFSELDAGLKNLFGPDFSLYNKESQQLLLQHLKINKEQNERMSYALERDPRLSQMMADIMDGKRNAHSAMARYFGSSIMNVREGTPEYEEMMLADEERREEVLRIAKDRHEYEENLENSRPVIERFCSERGYEPAEFMEVAWESLLLPILSGNYSYELCTALEHAVNYEQDVEDAFAAGDVKGRNTSISRMKEDFGDGMPKGLSSAAPDTAPVRKHSNSLIDKALEA